MMLSLKYLPKLPVLIVLSAVYFVTTSGVSAQTNNTVAALQALEGQLKQAGLQNCITKTKALSKYIMSSDEVNFVVHSVGSVNNGLISIAISQINPKTGARGLANISLVTANNLCLGTYEQINHWSASCSDVKSQVFVSYGKPRSVQRDIFQSELNSNTHTYFIPDDTGCTTLKKEIVQ